MIILAELQMQGEKHAQVNSGLLQILQRTFLNETILVRCDRVHGQTLKERNELSNNIIFDTFDYSGEKETKKINLPLTILRECRLVYKIFKHALSQRADLVVFASALPFIAIAINLLARFFKQNVIICLHGELGVLTLNSNKFTIRVFRKVIKYFFKKRYSTTGLLFYGDSIYKKLFELFPSFSKSNCVVIDHPYIYEGRTKRKLEGNPIVVANIGKGILNKNSHLIFSLAELCEKEVVSNSVLFIQHGNISPGVLCYANEYVKILGSNDKFISFLDFEKGMLSADYFVYFFKENSLYDLCPSGTFFDAIKYQVPIIALRNPFFTYYFNKLGNIGYLCDSIEEMSAVIKNIVSGRELDNYNDQISNLLTAQSTLSIANIAKDFSRQIKMLWQ